MYKTLIEPTRHPSHPIYKENCTVKHNAGSGYNIYSNSRRRRSRDRRKIFVVVCLLICMLCVILDIIFIAKIVTKGKDEVTASTSSSIAPETDESGNIITQSTGDPGQSSEPTETTTAKVQTVDAATRAANLEKLQADVADYLAKQNGRFGVYYINMSNGETMAYKESQPIVAASSIKMAYNTYLYEKAESGELSLDEKIAYKATAYPDGDLEYGTGTIQNKPDGTEFTLYEVSHLSITISDNCGTNMVIRRLGGEDAINNNFLKPISAAVDYRGTSTYTDYTGTERSGKRRTSAIDLAKYAEHLYKDYEGNQTHYQPLIDDLCNTEYNWGVPGGVPGDVKVAHKVGFNTSYFANNDVAIVFASEDYVLAVMTESGDANQAQQIIAEVSRMVYAYVESNYAPVTT